MVNNRYHLILLVIVSLSLYLSIRFLPYQLGLNVTESLPQKIFFLKKNVLPKRNGYAVFYKPNKWYKDSFVKKIIGVAGDEIQESDNRISIISKDDGQIIDAGIAKEFSLHGEKLTKISAVIIPQGYYFVHGSNKDSLDSRYVEIGLISKDEIIGTATPINGYYFLILLLIPCYFLARRFIARRKLLVLIFLVPFFSLFNHQSFAKDLGVQGNVYTIKETNLASDIKNKLKSLKKSGKLAKLEKQWQEKTIAGTKRPKPVDGLYKATKIREFVFDPTVELKKDIFDHQGNLVAAKGKKINPLDYHNLTENLLFIDGDDRQQLVWAKKKVKTHQAMIILTKGNIIDLMNVEKIRFYFDQGGFLVHTFGIQALPTIVYQSGKVLKIREEVI
jgi:conjugal transfer pilus assembly protein TraW